MCRSTLTLAILLAAATLAPGTAEKPVAVKRKSVDPVEDGLEATVQKLMNGGTAEAPLDMPALDPRSFFAGLAGSAEEPAEEKMATNSSHKQTQVMRHAASSGTAEELVTVKQNSTAPVGDGKTGSVQDGLRVKTASHKQPQFMFSPFGFPIPTGLFTDHMPMPRLSGGGFSSMSSSGGGFSSMSSSSSSTWSSGGDGKTQSQSETVTDNQQSDGKHLRKSRHARVCKNGLCKKSVLDCEGDPTNPHCQEHRDKEATRDPQPTPADGLNTLAKVAFPIIGNIFSSLFGDNASPAPREATPLLFLG